MGSSVTLALSHALLFISAPVFDGIIRLPTRKLTVATVEDDGILFDIVPTVETRIRIWTNDTLFPDEVVVGWGDEDVPVRPAE